MKIYRLTIWSHFEEDQEDMPYTLDFSSMDSAFNAYNQYSEEILLSGQRAYSVVGPYVLEV